MLDLYGFGDQIIKGALTTLQVAGLSLVFGTGLGLTVAIAKLSKKSLLVRTSDAYTTIIRGIPELLLILILYFGGTAALTALFGSHVEVDAFSAGVFALTIVFGAYASEVFRGAITAVPAGQIEAACALGLSKRHVWSLIILPQMVRFALPGLGNLWLVLLKDTALISVVGLDDLLRKAGMAAGSTHEPLIFYGAAAVIYLLFTSISLLALDVFERRAERGVRHAN